MKCVSTVLCASMSALVLTASATASVVVIGEFTGDLFEGFEGISSPAPWPGPMPIFGGAATFDDQFSDPWIVNSLTGNNQTIFAYDGNFMGLAPTGWTRWTFDTPVHRFGGFFASVQQGVGGSVRFLDANGTVMDTLAFSATAGGWSWHGWESSNPVSSIEILAGANPGTTMIYDNMQISFIPAPSALAMLLIGAGTMRRRRR